MRKRNLTISAALVAMLVISAFAIQPSTSEASNELSPSATPSPRTKRPPLNANVKIRKPKVKGAINGDDDWVRSPKPTQRSRKRKG